MRTTVVPRVTPETAGFWAHCRDGVLSVQQCSDCGHRRFPPQPMCSQCHSRSSSWAPVDPNATLYTYTVVPGPGATWEAPLPGEHGYPFAIAIVELGTANPVRMVTDIGTEWLDRIRIGMPMTVVFERVNDEINLPRFVPDPEESTRAATRAENQEG